MRIPKKVKIGPHIYIVKLEKDLSGNHGLMGQSRHTSSEIVIDPNLSGSQLEDTLLHEILHAIQFQTRFISDGEKDEELAVSRLTPLLLQVIKDNPEIFK